MERITWRAEWELGVPEVDDQHKHLIDLLNKRAADVMDDFTLLQRLIVYTADHFSDEEDIMLRNDYPLPRYKDHKKEHNKLNNVLLTLSTEVLKMDTDEKKRERIDNLHKLCFLWFRGHFIGTDKRLADFLRGGATDN